MNNKTFRFKIFSDDYFRVINQTGVRQRIGLCGLDYSHCWDTNLAPDGILYYAPCDETGRGRHTRLIVRDHPLDRSLSGASRIHAAGPPHPHLGRLAGVDDGVLRPENRQS